MPNPNWQNDIPRSELPHGWIGVDGKVTDIKGVTIYELAKSFDANYNPGAKNFSTTKPSGKASFAGSTFNTNSTGTTNANELFNGWKGKTGDNYDD